MSPSKEPESLRSTSKNANRPPTFLPRDGTVFPSRFPDTPSDLRTSSVVNNFPLSHNHATKTTVDRFLSMQTVEEDATYQPEDKFQESMSFHRTFNQERSFTTLGDLHSGTKKPDYDWTMFVNAYANGQWDPRQIPTPPRPSWPTSNSIYASFSDTHPHPPAKPEAISPWHDGTILDSPPGEHAPTSNSHVNGASNDERHPVMTSCQPSPIALKQFGPSLPPYINLPARRPRNSFSTSSEPVPFPSDEFDPPRSSLNSNQVQTTVATMRWAAASVDLFPLAIPSPERELTDPMHGVTATIPGSIPEDAHHDHVITPGGTRRPRLASFWEGTQDVDIIGLQALTPNSECLSLSQNDSDESPSHDTTPQQGPPTLTFDTARHPPSFSAIHTAPSSGYSSQNDLDSTPCDYFEGVLLPPESPSRDSPLTSLNHSQRSTSCDHGSKLTPRRVCLTRQSSSPLPILPHETRSVDGPLTSTNPAASKASRAVKEQQMYMDLGYLAPPNPPNEMERQRALYKCVHWPHFSISPSLQ